MKYNKTLASLVTGVAAATTMAASAKADQMSYAETFENQSGIPTTPHQYESSRFFWNEGGMDDVAAVSATRSYEGIKSLEFTPDRAWSYLEFPKDIDTWTPDFKFGDANFFINYDDQGSNGIIAGDFAYSPISAGFLGNEFRTRGFQDDVGTTLMDTQPNRWYRIDRQTNGEARTESISITDTVTGQTESIFYDFSAQMPEEYGVGTLMFRGSDFFIDNVSVIAPEPSTLGLFGAGALALAAARREKDNK
jgi:hypothetical protein